MVFHQTSKPCCYPKRHRSKQSKDLQKTKCSQRPFSGPHKWLKKNLKKCCSSETKLKFSLRPIFSLCFLLTIFFCLFFNFLFFFFLCFCFLIYFNVNNIYKLFKPFMLSNNKYIWYKLNMRIPVFYLIYWFSPNFLLTHTFLLNDISVHWFIRIAYV